MSRSSARLCSICKEEHALFEGGGPRDGDVCICDRCLETIARENMVWFCLRCRRVYLESKQVLREREKDPEIRSVYDDLMSECVIQGLESCMNCYPEMAYHKAELDSELIFC